MKTPRKDALAAAARRSVILLRAAIEIIQNSDAEDAVAFWDNAECDGACLIDEARAYIEDMERLLPSPLPTEAELLERSGVAIRALISTAAGPSARTEANSVLNLIERRRDRRAE